MRTTSDYGLDVVFLCSPFDSTHPTASAPQRETFPFLGGRELNDDTSRRRLVAVAPQPVAVLVFLVVAAGAVLAFAGQSVAVGLFFREAVSWAYPFASATQSEDLPSLGRLILKLRCERAIVRAKAVSGRLPIHRANLGTNGAAQSSEHTGPVAEALDLRPIGFEAGCLATVFTGDVSASRRAATRN